MYMYILLLSTLRWGGEGEDKSKFQPIMNLFIIIEDVQSSLLQTTPVVHPGRLHTDAIFLASILTARIGAPCNPDVFILYPARWRYYLVTSYPNGFVTPLTSYPNGFVTSLTSYQFRNLSYLFVTLSFFIYLLIYGIFKLLSHIK